LLSFDFTTVVELNNFEYNFDKASSSIDPQASQLEVIFEGTNSGSAPQNVGSVNQAITSTQTTGWTFSSATAISAKATVKAGIPFIGDGKLVSYFDFSFHVSKEFIIICFRKSE